MSVSPKFRHMLVVRTLVYDTGIMFDFFQVSGNISDPYKY